MKRTRMFFAAAIFAILIAPGGEILAQTVTPTLLVPNLSIRRVTGDLITPISIAFIGENDFLVLEKNTGHVKRFINGVSQGTVLDLAVNNASERGLLGITLHPRFPSNPGVYLFWTCRAAPPDPATPFDPSETECADIPEKIGRAHV